MWGAGTHPHLNVSRNYAAKAYSKLLSSTLFVLAVKLFLLFNEAQGTSARIPTLRQSPSNLVRPQDYRCSFIVRLICRSASRLARVARLSYKVLPRATPNDTLARPFLSK